MWSSSPSSFVQIINVGGYHLACLSNKLSPIQIWFSFMTVYCLHLAQLLLSKLVPFWSVRRHHSTFKWWMCNCSHHLILVVSMPLMAHDLCAGKDPCCMAYDESLMRSHLEPQCYESEKLSHLPRARRSCSRRIYKDVQVAVYCICHFPDVERFGHMAECDTCKLWYHQICLNIPDRVFKKTRSAKWTCSECS